LPIKSVQSTICLIERCHWEFHSENGFDLFCVNSVNKTRKCREKAPRMDDAMHRDEFWLPTFVVLAKSKVKARPTLTIEDSISPDKISLQEVFSPIANFYSFEVIWMLYILHQKFGIMQLENALFEDLFCQKKLSLLLLKLVEPSLSIWRETEYIYYIMQGAGWYNKRSYTFYILL